MTTTIDFDALQVSEGPRVTLLANQEVGGGLVGDDFADFSAFASLSVDVKVQRMSSTSPPPLLTILVEHSDDGLSWSTAETFTFTDDGEQTASLASPKAHVRASASGSGAEWYVKSVNVAPISGGGGSMPVTARGRYDTPGFGVSIANGGSDYVPWHLESGDALLDLTDPQFPTVLESGIYAVSVSVIPYDSMTADGFFTSVLILDRDDRDAESDVDSRLATDAQPAPEAHAALTYYVPAGHQIAVRVRNRDGTNTIRFDFDFANVQRIT